MKNWYAFLACLLLSFSIWLVMNLSRNSTAVESVTVQAFSNVEGRASVALEPVVVTARCKASGFRLLYLSFKEDEVVDVTFDASDLASSGEDEYWIDAARLSRYVQDIFGPGVTVESFIDPGLRLRFLSENFRKVPVSPVCYVNCRPQYMLLDEVKLSVDSVLVYGQAERINDIDRIKTQTITHNDLKRDVHGVVGLIVPEGVRLSESEVGYRLTVGRYVELHSSARIGTRNVPAGVDFLFSPSNVEVVWRCAYPLRAVPDEMVEFFVDYRDFEGSLTGKCLVRSSELPDGVIDFRTDPEYCDCFERSERQ